MNKKYEALQAWMNESNVDVSIVTSKFNVFYLSGFYSDPHERLLAYVSLKNQQPILICPAMEVHDAKKAAPHAEVIGYLDTDDSMELLSNEIKKRTSQVACVALEKEHLHVLRYESLLKAFPETKWVSLEDKLQMLRMVKDEDEIQKIQKACELADFAVDVGVKSLREGITEMEVIAQIEYEVKKKGVRQMSFTTMVLTGANAASPHGTPGATKVQKGDLVLFDLGVIYEGYCSDITRTVAFGDISDEQAKIYETVKNAEMKAIQAAKIGKTCADLDAIARNYIKEAGYGDYFTHRLGHGLGLSVHEYPSLTGQNQLPLVKGMCFTIEPGIYVPNVAGVRIEDDIIVTEHEPLVLTKYPKELLIV
ncbi:MAG TPA: Xaa-Pro peptidase family protein [Bacillus sp. (in: firmicutes)]|uniref:M24 family metallopeptidase n=1 Tax=Bacillus litorisediminis TaxID=2922713 RepID=UPI001FAEAD45|nr:Xaa-Pro peptidase family protein [Bacillus litorisediminis]HWO75485.1 Xaa-Pro peptidase family protein [Bacillus sp. (in: firmicutes)]